MTSPQASAGSDSQNPTALAAEVLAAMAMGLVKGEGFAVDASILEANASPYHGVRDQIALEALVRFSDEELMTPSALSAPRSPPCVAQFISLVSGVGLSAPSTSYHTCSCPPRDLL